MKFLRNILAAVSFFGVVANSSANAEDYAVGQVWSYKTRPGEENSHLVIVKITATSKDKITYGIFIEDVKLKNPHLAGGIQTSLPHAPVSKEVLDKSITKLIETRKKLPDYEEAYAEWKTAFDAGKGGVFSISIADILSTIEKAVNQ